MLRTSLRPTYRDWIEALSENFVYPKLASTTIWRSLVCRYTIPIFSLAHDILMMCLCFRAAVFCKDTSHTLLGAHPTPLWPHLSKLHLQLPSFQIRSHSELPEVRTSTYLFRRDSYFWGVHKSTRNETPGTRCLYQAWCGGSSHQPRNRPSELE